MVEHDVRARSDVAAEGSQGVSEPAGRFRRLGRQSAPGPKNPMELERAGGIREPA